MGRIVLLFQALEKNIITLLHIKCMFDGELSECDL